MLNFIKNLFKKTPTDIEQELFDQYMCTLTSWKSGYGIISANELTSRISKWTGKFWSIETDKIIISDSTYSTFHNFEYNTKLWRQEMDSLSTYDSVWSKHYDCDDFALNYMAFQQKSHLHRLNNFISYISKYGLGTSSTEELSDQEVVDLTLDAQKHTPQSQAIGMIHYHDEKFGPHVATVQVELDHIYVYDPTRGSRIELSDDEKRSIDAIYF